MPATATKPPPDRVADLERAMRYLRENALDGVGLTDAAEMACMSPFHFHRLFRDHFGRTPKQVTVDAQIAEAKARLICGEKLSSVATACGFSSQGHFTFRFHQATGATPTAWLRKLREIAEKTGRPS